MTSDRSLLRRPRFFVVLAICAVLVVGIASTLYVLRPVEHEYTLTVPARDERPDITLQYGSKPALTDYSFFSRVRERFTRQNADFIAIDLNEMVLKVFKDGERVMKAPVKAKGERGSWWETPAGLYKIRAKERDHITSFGGLHMPWSMQFHGNFFIHGWPYFDSGQPVGGDTSAGCIRLSSDVAKRMYGIVELGTPVLVHEKRMTKTDSEYTYVSQNIDISADHYLAADLNSHQALIQKAQTKRAPMSDVTYLMVALASAEQIGVEENVTALTSGTEYSNIKKGRAYRVYDLYFPLLRSASDGAARSLASFRRPEWFTDAMNGQARALGMSETTFKGVTRGAGNRATPKDIFALVKYLYNYRSFILSITSGDVDTGVYGPGRIDAMNRNAFHEDDAFLGGIVLDPDGGSGAGVAVFSVSFGDETRPIAFIVLESNEPVRDIKTMRQHVRQTYSITNNSAESTAVKGSTSTRSYTFPLLTEYQTVPMGWLTRMTSVVPDLY